MKKVLIVLLCVAFAGVSAAQYQGDKSILYGTVRADGHKKATKGAFWKVRPEAKLIYEGGRPLGYTVYVLDRPSFVRYIEHNNSDDNYIVFEVGSVVYTDASGQFYDSYCGNKIEYLGAVERFVIQEKGTVVLKPEPEEDWKNYKAPKKDNVIQSDFVPMSIPIEKEQKHKRKTWFGRNIVPIAATFFIASAGIYVATNHHDAPPVIGSRTMPPGIH